MVLREIRVNARNWVDLAQDRDDWRTLVNWVLKLRDPLTTGLLIEFLNSETHRMFSFFYIFQIM